MSNAEKTIRMLHAKPMMTDVLDKLLDRIDDVAQAVGLDPAEFGLAFFMDCLNTMMQVAKEMGYTVDVDGFANALKKSAYGEE